MYFSCNDAREVAKIEKKNLECDINVFHWRRKRDQIVSSFCSIATRLYNVLIKSTQHLIVIPSLVALFMAPFAEFKRVQLILHRYIA